MTDIDSLFVTAKAGEILRNAGIAQVTKNERKEFRAKVTAAFLLWLVDAPDTFLIEDFRMHWEATGGGVPHHHNFWGAITRFRDIADRIEPTGEVRTSRSATSHARRMLVWRRKVL